MTKSELKRNVEKTGSLFFSRETMRFFGDTMQNYGVCDAIIDTPTQEGLEVYELYRKKPVKHGLNSSAFFCRDTFERVYKEIEINN